MPHLFVVVFFSAECDAWWTGGETLNPDTTVMKFWFWNLSNRTAPMIHMSWAFSEPNNFGDLGEKYLIMSTQKNFMWMDVAGSFIEPMCALCEFDMEP